MGGLAAALQQAKLKKTQPKENSGGSTTSSGSSGYGTIGRSAGAVGVGGGGGGGGLMDEMQKTLARRRAKAEGNHDDDHGGSGNGLALKRDGTSPSSAKSTGSESPKAPLGGRRRFGSMADDLDNAAKVNGGGGGDSAGGSGNLSAEQEALKQEIMREVRKELQKMKSELLEGKLNMIRGVSLQIVNIFLHFFTAIMNRR